MALFNEANAAALAETPAQARQRMRTSCSSPARWALVAAWSSAAELFTGPAGHAGEVGHVVVDPGGSLLLLRRNGLPGNDGRPGRHLCGRGHGRPAGDSRSAAMRSLLAALDAGDPGPYPPSNVPASTLGVALASTARVVDIGSVVLGGHFAVLDQWLRAPLLASLDKYAPGKLRSRTMFTSPWGSRARCWARPGACCARWWTRRTCCRASRGQVRGLNDPARASGPALTRTQDSGGIPAAASATEVLACMRRPGPLFGAPGGNRTPDRRIRRPLLYPLSY